MIYFNNCNTLEEVKGLYRKLAKENHPDAGGSTETMQAINKEYAFACASILSGSNLSAEEVDKKMRFSEEYRQVIEKIIHLPNIIIELVGLWIWVTGDTRPVKTDLQKAGLYFAPKKAAWYYRSEQFKVLRGGNKSLAEIRRKYGAETINRKQKEKVIEN